MPRFKLPSTLSVLAALFLAGFGWEFWTIANREHGDTFSAVIRKLGTNQPFIVFMLGMTMGHLWWPLLDKEDIEESIK